MFPTCSEILEVIRAMGYVRITPPAADAASGDASPALPSDEAAL
jgi:hypothetical protein